MTRCVTLAAVWTGSVNSCSIRITGLTCSHCWDSIYGRCDLKATKHFNLLILFQNFILYSLKYNC
jgi:hypothetical protein